MKKIITAALIASLLILPLGGTALADNEQDRVQSTAAQDFLPGDMPAELTPADSMVPAIHALVLAMLNYDAAAFDPADAGLAWESVYNMLSLYGQLDDRSEELGDTILLPEETAQDYAAALDLCLADLPALPRSLRDRLTLSGGEYRVVCGSDGLAQIQVEDVSSSAGTIRLTGALVYDVDGGELARFQAELQPRDNMFGYAVTALTLG